MMDEKRKMELEELMKTLEAIKGRHTELITVLIPADYNILSVAKQLEDERGTATNIKSTNTRKSVLDSLDRIIRFLKGVKNDKPKNGLAVYCGNISETEGVEDIQLWSIEPPQPLRTRMYRCDKEFFLEPLKQMLEVQEVYGLVVMDRKEATIGLLEGKQIKVLRKMTSGIPGKVRAGGQSAARFSRITDGLTKEFFRRVADNVKECFFNLPKLKGIIIGGPIPTKEEFLVQGELVTALKDKIIGMKDLGYADEHGLELLVESSEDLLAQQEIMHEKLLLESFFEKLGKHQEKTAHGYEPVKKALKFGAVQKLILSKKLDKAIIQELSDMAASTSSEVEIVSTETPEGEQFFNLSGIGAILRYAI